MFVVALLGLQQLSCSSKDRVVQVASGGAGGAAGAAGAAGSGATAGAAGAGIAQRSCVGLAAKCGTTSKESCCATGKLVTGGSFKRSYDAVSYTDPGYPAKVSDFSLDRFEITVGRFRKFVAQYARDMIPSGAGKNPNDPSDNGWNIAWNAELPADATELRTALKCDPKYQTWTDDPAANEQRPINCLNWYDALAFCIWDGGRLPTEAEWNYAASGGSEQRVYPWSEPPGNPFIQSYHAHRSGTASTANVGSYPAGDGRWGQADLSGNVAEWVRDNYIDFYIMPCENCTVDNGGPSHVFRGGAWQNNISSLLASARHFGADRTHDRGARCARAL